MNDSESTFEYQGEVFNVMDFEALTVDELVNLVSRLQEEAKAQGTRPFISDNIALPVFLKYSDHIGILMEVSGYDMIFPGLGFGVVSDQNRLQVLMIPFEDQWHKKTDWSYTTLS